MVSQEIRQIHMRHGEWTGAMRESFRESQPDLNTGLIDQGRRQAVAAAIVAQQAGLAIGSVYSSEMPRAAETAEIFCDASRQLGVDGIADPQQLPGLHEIHNGFLEGCKVPSDLNQQCHRTNVAIVKNMLRGSNCPEKLLRHAPWVTPRNFAIADTPLLTALRSCRTLDEYANQPDSWFVGHRGTMGYARAIATSLTRQQRESLTRVHATMADAQADIRLQLQQYWLRHLGDHLPHARPWDYVRNITPKFNKFRTSLPVVVEWLGNHNVPPIRTYEKKISHIGNCGIVEVVVQPDGLWRRERYIQPQFNNENLAAAQEPNLENMYHLTPEMVSYTTQLPDENPAWL